MSPPTCPLSVQIRRPMSGRCRRGNRPSGHFRHLLDPIFLACLNCPRDRAGIVAAFSFRPARSIATAAIPRADLALKHRLIHSPHFAARIDNLSVHSPSGDRGRRRRDDQRRLYRQGCPIHRSSDRFRDSGSSPGHRRAREIPRRLPADMIQLHAARMCSRSFMAMRSGVMGMSNQWPVAL
jgi:hypothetical protein